MSNMRLFFVSAILISMVAGIVAIDCYQCNGSGCKDPFDPSGSGVIKGCTTPEFFSHCQKIVYGSEVTRFCASSCHEGCSGDVCTHCCTSDFCNGGNAFTTSLVTMGVVVFAGFILASQ
nr:uncharacterized protein LOC129268844 [Lytechinus pictus]